MPNMNLVEVRSRLFLLCSFREERKGKERRCLRERKLIGWETKSGGVFLSFLFFLIGKEVCGVCSSGGQGEFVQGGRRGFTKEADRARLHGGSGIKIKHIIYFFWVGKRPKFDGTHSPRVE